MRFTKVLVLASVMMGSVVWTSVSADGEAVYNSGCMACHMPGVAGAPKLGDVAAWEPRIAKGMETLYDSGINGLAPGMPARGMCFTCSDDELNAVVDYMVAESR